MHTRKSDYLLPLLVIFLLTCLFHSRQLFCGGALVSTNLYQYLPWRHLATEQHLAQPVNPLLSDTLALTIPYHSFARDSVSQGVFPMWTPNIMCGYPLGATGSGFFYPFFWASQLFDLVPALTASSVVRTFFAGLFMFLYLKEIGLGRGISLFGAMCFMFNGFFLVWLEYHPFADAAVWLPLMFLAVERLLKKPGPGSVLLLALAVSMSVLAGMFQITLYALYAMGLYAAWRAGMERRTLGRGGTLRFFAGFGGAGLLAVALCAVEILPFYELLSNSYRRVADLRDEFFPLVNPPEAMIQFLMPEFFGSPVEGDFWFLGMAQHLNAALRESPGWGTNLTELNGYTGAVVFVLALIGLTASRKSLARFFLCLAALAIAPAFSKTALTVFYHVVPGFQTSWPGRTLFIYMFSVILLACLGLERLERAAASCEHTGPEGVRVRNLCFIAVLAAMLFLLVVGCVKATAPDFLNTPPMGGNLLWGRLSAYHVAISAAAFFWPHTVRTILIFSATMGSLGILLVLLQKRKLGYSVFLFLTAALCTAELMHFHFRFHPFQRGEPYFTTGGIEFVRNTLGSARVARFGNPEIIPFNTGLPFGLRDVQGYVPLAIDRMSDFLKLLDERSMIRERSAVAFGNPNALTSQLLDLAGVKYVLTDTKTGLMKPALRLAYQDGIRIYENTDVLHRAFFVSDYLVQTPREALAQSLAGGDVDLRRVVVLEEHPDGLTPSSQLLTARAEITRERNNEVLVELSAPSDGMLVLCDAYYPGWKAYVDGTEVKIYRADLAFRAVPVKKGIHAVRFAYQPRSLLIGAIISGVTLLATIGGVLAFIVLPKQRAARAAGNGKPDISK
ncbi:MAG: hypothetical protein Kow0099_12650 [Candidatus Abyssubacteria bacterium]